MTEFQGEKQMIEDLYARVSKWVKFSDTIGDRFLKFMVLWMALNALYATHAKDNMRRCEGAETARTAGRNRRGKQLGKELQELMAFFDHNNEHYTISPFIVNEEFLQKIISSRNAVIAREAWKTLNNSDESDYNRSKALWKIMYYIRCNLFHGSKDIDNERDRILTSEGAKILHTCLKRHLESVRR